MRDAKVMAEAITALTERVVGLEQQLATAAAARRPEPKGEAALAETERRIVADKVRHAGIVDASSPQDGDRPAHHVAPSVAESPGDEGAPFRVGGVVVVNLALGGLFVGVVVGHTDTHVTVDGGVRGGKMTVSLDQVLRCPDAWRRDR